TGHCDPSGPGGPVGPVGPTLPSITNIQFKNPLKVGSLTELINRLIDFIFTVSLIVAPILLVIAGVVFMTAAGDSSRVGTARRMLMWTIVGFGIILISKGLVEVLRGILGVTGPAP
ncbi:MAG TPA: pilin, partial [Candidatus Paceibacterota bacterium]|nr:pilin [Candidatus Paceibacterota bacterium]